MKQSENTNHTKMGMRILYRLDSEMSAELTVWAVAAAGKRTWKTNLISAFGSPYSEDHLSVCGS